MDTLTTIHDNLVTLSSAHIDWSLSAGPIWLVGMMAGLTVFTAFSLLRSS